MLSVWWWLSLLWTLPLREIICWRIKISFHCFFFAINFRQQRQQHIVVSEESKWKRNNRYSYYTQNNNNRERCCAGLLNINVTLMSLRETFVMQNRHAMKKKFLAKFEWIRIFGREIGKKKQIMLKIIDIKCWCSMGVLGVFCLLRWGAFWTISIAVWAQATVALGWKKKLMLSDYPKSERKRKESSRVRLVLRAALFISTQLERSFFSPYLERLVGEYIIWAAEYLSGGMKGIYKEQSSKSQRESSS